MQAYECTKEKLRGTQLLEIHRGCLRLLLNMHRVLLANPFSQDCVLNSQGWGPVRVWSLEFVQGQLSSGGVRAACRAAGGGTLRLGCAKRHWCGLRWSEGP